MPNLQLGEDDLCARDIFVFNQYPERSYVEREQYRLLKSELESTSSTIIKVYGPSRVGKSMLVEHCLRVESIKQNRIIQIEGASVRRMEQFMNELLHQLNIVVDSTDDTNGTSVNIGFFKFDLTRKDSRTEQAKEQFVRSKLLSESTILIIDDFHYIPKDERSKIMRYLKAWTGGIRVGEKYTLKVIILFVPAKEIHESPIWQELQGRLTPVNFTLWKVEELQRIMSEQFNNVQTFAQGLAKLATECYGLPIIMQRFCLTYFNKYHNGYIPARERVQISEERVHAVCNQVGLLLWNEGNEQLYRELISQDSLAVGGNFIVPKINNKRGNINQIIWYALTSQEFKGQRDIVVREAIEIETEAVIRRMRKVSHISADILSDNEISHCIDYMSQKAHAKYIERLRNKTNPDEFISDPIIEYNAEKGLFKVFSPSFFVALRHSGEQESYFKRN